MATVLISMGTLLVDMSYYDILIHFNRLLCHMFDTSPGVPSASLIEGFSELLCNVYSIPYSQCGFVTFLCDLIASGQKEQGGIYVLNRMKTYWYPKVFDSILNTQGKWHCQWNYKVSGLYSWYAQVKIRRNYINKSQTCTYCIISVLSLHALSSFILCQHTTE